MKKSLLLFLVICVKIAAYSQPSQVNLNEGTWKNPNTWLYGKVPNDTQHIILIRDLVVDTIATCRSLTTNGFAIVIAPGASLNITGSDSSAMEATGDTLLIGFEYYDLETGSFLQTGTRYRYDSLKRLAYKIDSIEDEPISISKYHYEGSSRLPDIITRSEDYGIPTRYTYDTSYLFYDDNGLILKDSLVFLYAFNGTNDWTRGTAVIKYTYDNGRIIKTINSQSTRLGGGSSSTSTSSDVQYFFQKKLGDVIIYQADTIMDFYNTTLEHFFKVDSHPNPFYSLPAESPLFSVEHFSTNPPYQQNNILEEKTIDVANESLRTDNYYYRYNALGYPAELFNYENSNGFINYGLVRFKYGSQ